MKYDTIKEAAQAWVREFNAIPSGVVEKLMQYSDYCDFNEITPIAEGDNVYIYCGEYSGERGTIEAYDGETRMYVVNLDNGEQEQFDESEFEVERDGGLPMWGTMWTFRDSCDEYWIEEKDGLSALATCGFRVYESEDWGYVFGIDGAGYDFYEEHWIPLYKSRGLKWHKETGDK